MSGIRFSRIITHPETTGSESLERTRNLLELLVRQQEVLVRTSLHLGIGALSHHHVDGGRIAHSLLFQAHLLVECTAAVDVDCGQDKGLYCNKGAAAVAANKENHSPNS